MKLGVTMKIAIASDGKKVSGHFGHCEGFSIYEVEANKILKEAFVENPGHRPGYLPIFLKKLNVDIIIADGMGETAQELFENNQLQVIVGAVGDCSNIIEAYINNNLKSTGSVCRGNE